VAVVAAFKFDDVFAAGEGAGQTDGGHGGSVPELTKRIFRWRIRGTDQLARSPSTSVDAPKLALRAAAPGWLLPRAGKRGRG